MSNVNRFVYHYCAQYKEPYESMVSLDGIALLEKRITCMEDYRTLKGLIDKDHKLTIISLAFHGMEFEDDHN